MRVNMAATVARRNTGREEQRDPKRVSEMAAQRLNKDSTIQEEHTYSATVV